MKRLLTSSIAFLTVAMGIARAQDIVGNWQGTLNAGPQELRLVLHIVKNEDGSLKGTIDSVDQGANGIPVSALTLKDSNLNLVVDAVHASYEGTVKGSAEIDGIWTQGQPFPLRFKRAATSIKVERKPSLPSDIDGAWLGALDTGMAKLRFVLHIDNTEDGLTATVDSPDQGANGLPVTSIARNGLLLNFNVRGAGGSFSGRLDPELSVLAGTWTQLDNAFPLTLKRVKDASELEQRRPQDPKRPYPYLEEEVSYENKAAGVRLSATLTRPPGKGPSPAVLLIAGSGAHDRDESLMGHRPFLVLTDYLTRRGIAVLRADKRGCGKSTGNFAAATIEDFANDADAGVAFLKTRPEVDPHKIGLVGHSEGGIVAPMSAIRNPVVSFIVLLAGPGVTGEQILTDQAALILKAAGKSDKEIAEESAEQRDLLEVVRRGGDNTSLGKQLREKLAGKVPEALLEPQINSLTSSWFRHFLAYDPAVVLRKVTCPVLAINGEKDLQVSAKQNLPVIQKALTEAGNKHFEVAELPGLNHLFQTAKTGAPSEYAQIEETMSPTVLEKVATWIMSQ